MLAVCQQKSILEFCYELSLPWLCITDMHTAIWGNPEGISLDVSGPVVDLDTCRDAADMQALWNPFCIFSKLSFFFSVSSYCNSVLFCFFYLLCSCYWVRESAFFMMGFRLQVAHIYMFPVAITLTDFAIQFVTWCIEVLWKLLNSVFLDK